MFLKPRLTKNNRLVCLVLLALSFSQYTLADINETIENALKLGQEDAKYGQINFDLRYRYENANTEKTSKETANSDTVRLRLGYLTPEFSGFQAFAEYEGLQDIFTNNYNSIRNGKTQYDVIADPQQNELNQLWISYKGIADTEIKLGRQRIIIDNARFIGNVGWRQLEQTYDAVMLTNQSLPNTTIKAGYIINTRDIFSKENDMDAQFVNVGYKIDKIGKLTGYTYLIDFQESKALNSSSNQTYGIRFNGSYPLTDEIKALYTAEYALQKDLGDNPIDYEVDYINVMAGISLFGVKLKASLEQLGGRNGKGFDTPLATKHAFQGWADVFLATPVDGIRDMRIALITKIMGVKLIGLYDNYDDDTGSQDYGQEFGLQVVKKFAKHYTLSAKYAYYDAESLKTDTQRFWLHCGISF